MKENRLVHKLHSLPAKFKLLLSVVIAAFVFLFNKERSEPPMQFMSTWLSFAISNLVFLWFTIFTAHPQEIRDIAKKQDSNSTIIFLVILVAAFFSLFAILFLLRILPDTKESSYYLHIALAIGSVICSWLLIHTIFTLHYAHLFYTCKTQENGIKKEHPGGLKFPNDKTPDYLDFAYFSFVIGMTFQVSDVQVSSSHIRRLALLHSLLSFAFNTVILALSINVVSGLIQK